VIMGAKVLLDRNPRPSKKEIVAALSAHLCRCTGYKKIVEKGIGEVPTVGPAVAIANTVVRACGFRSFRLPITPGQIREKFAAAD